MKNKKIVAFMLSCVLCLTFIPIKAQAENTKNTILITINNTDNEQIHVVDFGYGNNTYVSLSEMSYYLKDTNRAFEYSFSKDEDNNTIIVFNNVDGSSENDNDEESDDKEAFAPYEEWENGEIVKYSRKKIPVYIDNNEYRFYLIFSEDKEDVFMSLGEFAIAMDMDITCVDGAIHVNTTGEFDINTCDVANNNICYMTDSCIVGDATTGNIYFAENEDAYVSIASTTKLMTYLLVMEAIDNGQLSMNDSVVFPKDAEMISKSSDMVVDVVEGQTATVGDALKAMLISSSNECALALAEKVGGNEEAFVAMMNDKAKSLGMSENARFFNPHGLPHFEKDVLNVKLQNHLTANDMFILASYILDKYPQVTDITSIKTVRLESFPGKKFDNTNVLLYNIPGCVGLKTGTTDKSASCLVSAYKSDDKSGNPHYVVTIVYGAENAQTQGYSSLVLMKYGIRKFNAGELGIVPDRGDNNEIPDNLEGLVGNVINCVRRENS